MRYTIQRIQLFLLLSIRIKICQGKTVSVNDKFLYTVNRRNRGEDFTDGIKWFRKQLGQLMSAVVIAS